MMLMPMNHLNQNNYFGIETMKVNNTSTTILIVATGLLHKYRREDDLSHSNAYDSIS